MIRPFPQPQIRRQPLSSCLSPVCPVSFFSVFSFGTLVFPFNFASPSFKVHVWRPRSISTIFSPRESPSAYPLWFLRLIPPFSVVFSITLPDQFFLGPNAPSPTQSVSLLVPLRGALANFFMKRVSSFCRRSFFFFHGVGPKLHEETCKSLCPPLFFSPSKSVLSARRSLSGPSKIPDYPTAAFFPFLSRRTFLSTVLPKNYHCLHFGRAFPPP